MHSCTSIHFTIQSFMIAKQSTAKQAISTAKQATSTAKQATSTAEQAISTAGCHIHGEASHQHGGMPYARRGKPPLPRPTSHQHGGILSARHHIIIIMARQPFIWAMLSSVNEMQPNAGDRNLPYICASSSKNLGS
jgi:hypothetical protein